MEQALSIHNAPIIPVALCQCFDMNTLSISGLHWQCLSLSRTPESNKNYRKAYSWLWHVMKRQACGATITQALVMESCVLCMLFLGRAAVHRFWDAEMVQVQNFHEFSLSSNYSHNLHI